MQDLVTGLIETINDKNADEFSWISEVIDDIVDKYPSKKLVEGYKSLMTKFPEECSKYNIAGVIEICENLLKWEEENGKK